LPRSSAGRFAWASSAVHDSLDGSAAPIPALRHQIGDQGPDVQPFPIVAASAERLSSVVEVESIDVDPHTHSTSLRTQRPHLTARPRSTTREKPLEVGSSGVSRLEPGQQPHRPYGSAGLIGPYSTSVLLPRFPKRQLTAHRIRWGHHSVRGGVGDCAYGSTKAASVPLGGAVGHGRCGGGVRRCFRRVRSARDRYAVDGSASPLRRQVLLVVDKPGQCLGCRSRWRHV